MFLVKKDEFDAQKSDLLANDVSMMAGPANTFCDWSGRRKARAEGSNMAEGNILK